MQNSYPFGPNPSRHSDSKWLLALSIKIALAMEAELNLEKKLLKKLKEDPKFGVKPKQIKVIHKQKKKVIIFFISNP